MFEIFTDTSANLPSDVLAKRHISLIPLHFVVNGKEYEEENTKHFNGKEFYSKIREGVQVSTAQINPQQYIDRMTPALKRGCDVLFLSMSSGISGSFQSACLAIKQLKESFPEQKIFAIDTLAASLGEGIQILKAADLRDANKSIDEVIDYITKMRKRIYQIFTVDDLMHLCRTGRLSNTKAFIGSILKVKPILKGNEQGKIIAIAQKRGRKLAISALADKYNEVVKNAKNQIVGIAHADAPQDAEMLKNHLQKDNPPKEIMVVDYEPVTGSHVGPGTVALFFEGGADARSK